MSISEIDKFLKNMFFLKKFGFEERQKLLLQSFYSYYGKGTAIFHQGDIGDFMYIILKGSVGIRIKNISFGTEPLIVATLHEGDQFGELALINDEKKKVGTKSRRRASCVCMEDCHLIGFPADIVNELILYLLNTKLKDDIEFFKNIDYFCELGSSDIFPLISNMKRLKFSYGDYILREGEIPKGMYIIRSGKCELCIETLGRRNINNISCDNIFEENLPTEISMNRIMSNKGFSNNIICKKQKDNLETQLIYHNLVCI